MTPEPVLQGLTAKAIDELAARVAVDPNDIEVVSAETVVWPDSSLGCPKPGMRYRQVPEDGALIQLHVGGRVYRYHSGGTRTEPFLCEQPQQRAATTPDPRLTPRPSKT